MHLAINIGIDKIMFFVYVTLYAGMAIPIFTLNLAYVNDYIPKEKFVAAGAGLQFVFGLGAMSGPFLCSIFMDLVGENGFFIFLIIFHSLIGIFGIYRLKARPTKENPDSQFVPVPQTITPVGMELNPTTEHIEEPYTEKVKKMLERKGVSYKKEDELIKEPAKEENSNHS